MKLLRLVICGALAGCALILSVISALFIGAATWIKPEESDDVDGGV